MSATSKQALAPAAFPFFDYRHYAFSLGVQAGGRVWLAGHTASRHDPASGRMVVTGTLAEQAAVSHAKQQALLAAADLDFGNVVRIVDYLTPAGRDAYADLAAPRRELFGAAPPAVSSMVVNSLLRPDALIETEVVAAIEPGKRIAVGHGLAGVPAAAAVESSDLLYCSALLPLDEAGRVVRGGLVAQTRQVYRNAEAVLHEAGYAWSDVIKTVEFVRAEAPGDYRDTWQVRAAHLGAPGETAVAATGVPMRELAHPEALIQIEFTAYRGGGRALNPGWPRYARLTYAPAVRAGEYVCVSGQLALDPETNAIVSPGDIVGQTRYVYGNIGRVLATAGLGLDSIVKTVEYITPAGLAAYRDTADLRKALSNAPYPAATGVVCETLLHPEALIEVDCWAVGGGRPS